jgi:hypothetical protein
LKSWKGKNKKSTSILLKLLVKIRFKIDLPIDSFCTSDIPITHNTTDQIPKTISIKVKANKYYQPTYYKKPFSDLNISLP